MIVVAVDPGTEQSGLVTFDGVRITEAVVLPNERIVEDLRNTQRFRSPTGVLVVEAFESYGMAVGREVFRTIRWTGNFEALFYPGRVEFLPRRDIKQHLCHTARACDANIRQALIDRFGGQEKAIGKKASQGPLYALKGHLWAAFAVAITYYDLHANDGELIRPGISADF